ncbi:protein-tyrosine phosphatase family protein [Desulfogranum mediterraneum]|uniref:protein-tyrosine phosphatase family protein n=1 Tax=Desulfogranum mediterraneum TaxID=160661 RepID=UPI000420FF5F|nr:dual specificity protein phosphatase family protein [Desulfogranum mediterraneum]
MAGYKLTWITEYLAVGHAPMSYADLDSIREQGISGIVNLCGEFSDLHDLEEAAGFEVFYLPIADETAPTMEAMEQGLAWLDEAVYLGKKVLVHCKLGVGRTGTFVTAYMLRRGFNLKKAGKLLRKTRANPTNFAQWWLLRKFGRKEGQLKLAEPSAENRLHLDLTLFYQRYEQLLQRLDALLGGEQPQCCGRDSASCGQSFSLSLIEALYLNDKVNISLSSQQRNQVIEKAAGSGEREKTVKEGDEEISGRPATGSATEPVSAPLPDDPAEQACPLREGDHCLLHQYRPIHCRTGAGRLEPSAAEEIHRELALLSRQVFTALFGEAAEQLSLPEVSGQETISGKFIQRYFQHLVSQKRDNGKK